MAEDQLQSARETVDALHNAARSLQKDSLGHPRRSESLETVVARATAFGERWGELVLTVHGTTLSAQGNVVHEDRADGIPLAGSLAKAGVRTLTLGSGLAREEIQSLVEALSRAGRGDEDLVCALWRAGLWAVSVEAEDEVDREDEATGAATVAILERLEDLRSRARTPGGEGLEASPPVGRDWAIEAPPPQPVPSLGESRAEAGPNELLRRVVEVVRAALWRADASLAPEASARALAEVIRRVLDGGDLELAIALLDRADPPEAPASAVKAAEKLVALLGSDLVRTVPALYAHRAPQGEEKALNLALRAFEHLDSHGVQAAASAYPTTLAAGRRPLRRLLSARGSEALDGLVRIADHRSLDVAKDGLAMLALVPLERARDALQRFVDDPTTPRDRLDIARNALEHAKANKPKGQRSAAVTKLIANLKDPSKDTRIAAARSLARLGRDEETFVAVETLVVLPGFPAADPDEQKALLEALVGAGSQEKAVRTLELVAQRTNGLPTQKLARQFVDTLKKAKAR